MTKKNSLHEIDNRLWVWWTPTFCSVIQLQKSVFISKISNLSFRNRFPFYKKFPRNAKIVLRCCRLEHDGSFNSSLAQERIRNRSPIRTNRAPIFYETNVSKSLHNRTTILLNRSTIFLSFRITKQSFF